MNEKEEMALAHRVAEDSEVFDFSKALELVRRRPGDAEKLIRQRQESKKQQEELDRAYRGLHRAAQALQ
jgi:hypothetical protein